MSIEDNKESSPTVTSVQDFLAKVEDRAKQNSGRYVFRGQEDSTWLLVSSAARRIEKVLNLNKSKKTRITNKHLRKYHLDLLDKAKVKGFHYKNNYHLTDIDLLADLQHHGCATLLMDFTKNSLIALYFACKSTINRDGDIEKDGKVFIINVNDERFFKRITFEMCNDKYPENTDIFENLLTKSEAFTDYKEDLHIKNEDSPIFYLDKKLPLLENILCENNIYYYFWEPNSVNTRISAQHSVFICGRATIDTNETNEIVIDKNAKKDILKSLDLFYNINDTTLFNDLEGFSISNSVNSNIQVFSIDEKVEKAEYYLNNGELKMAEILYNEVLDLQPKNLNALIFLSELNLNNNNFKKAIEYLDNLNKIYESNKLLRVIADVSCLYGKELFKLKDTENSFQYLSKSIDILKNLNTNLFDETYIGASLYYSDVLEIKKIKDGYDYLLEYNRKLIKKNFKGNNFDLYYFTKCRIELHLYGKYLVLIENGVEVDNKSNFLIKAKSNVAKAMLISPNNKKYSDLYSNINDILNDSKTIEKSK